MPEMSGYNNSYRFVNELSRLSKQIGQHKLSYQGSLFDVGLSQQQKRRDQQNSEFSQNMQLRKKGAELDQNLRQRTIDNLPSFGESFFSAFLPGATRAVGNSYLQGKQRGMHQQGREQYLDTMGMINGRNTSWSDLKVDPNY